MNWAAHVYYDSTSPSCLRRLAGNGRRVKAHDTAGGLARDGYYLVRVGTKKYLAHRIIWELHNGPIPVGIDIDHINRNKADNRISNLRLASASENLYNRPKQINNTSGYKGVSWSKDRGKWVATITQNKVARSLGRFHTPEEAYEAYCKAADLLHKEFAHA